MRRAERCFQVSLITRLMLLMLSCASIPNLLPMYYSNLLQDIATNS